MNEPLGFTPKNFDNDYTGREYFAQNLINYLSICRYSVEGSFVVTLNGSYGSGKSVFLDLLTNKLEDKEERHVFTKDRIIRIDAWEGDFIGNPILQLVTEIYNTLITKGDKKDAIQFKKATTGFLKASKIALQGFAKEKIGEEAYDDITEIATSIKEEDGTTLFDKITSNYIEQKKQIDGLSKLLSKICDDGEKPVLIIVDELDRCRPDYAVHFLETLKHLFDAKGVVFLLSTDLNALEGTVKCMFGESTNFQEYYRKFSHNTVNLPIPRTLNKESFFRQQLETYLSEYFATNTKHNPHNHFQEIADTVTKLIDLEKYTLRQIHHFLRVFSFALTNQKTNSFSTESIPVICYLCKIYVIDPTLYKVLAQRKIDTLKILDTIEESVSKPLTNYESRVFALLISSIYPSEKRPPSNFNKFFSKEAEKQCMQILQYADPSLHLNPFLSSIDFYSGLTPKY